MCHVQGEINDVGRTKPMSSVLAVLALELCFHCHEHNQLQHAVSVSRRRMSGFVLFIDRFFQL